MCDLWRLYAHCFDRIFLILRTIRYIHKDVNVKTFTIRKNDLQDVLSSLFILYLFLSALNYTAVLIVLSRRVNLNTFSDTVDLNCFLSKHEFASLLHIVSMWNSKSFYDPKLHPRIWRGLCKLWSFRRINGLADLLLGRKIIYTVLSTLAFNPCSAVICLIYKSLNGSSRYSISPPYNFFMLVLSMISHQ